MQLERKEILAMSGHDNFDQRAIGHARELLVAYTDQDPVSYRDALLSASEAPLDVLDQLVKLLAQAIRDRADVAGMAYDDALADLFA